MNNNYNIADISESFWKNGYVHLKKVFNPVELKALRKFQKDSGITSEITTRLKKAILSVNGDDSIKRINEFVDTELLSRDSLAFREYLREITPDVDMSFTFVSEQTGEDTDMDIPLDVEFFWPAGRR